jgi:hypothetical protein
MELHPWIVYIHVLGAFGFVLGHGASVFVALRLRGERDPARVAAMLQVSEMSLGLFYIGLLLLLVGGIAAGFTGGFWGRLWIWVALGLLAVVIAAMFTLATPYYSNLRQAVGLRSPSGKKDAPPPPPVSATELAALLDSPRPYWLAATGSIGLAVIIWLMLFKPF